MKRNTRSTTLLLVLMPALLQLAAYPHPARAGELSNSISATDQELSAIRGGFVTDGGLLVSFGIDRAIYVNGVLETASSIPVTLVGTQQAPPTLTSANPIRVVQLGPLGSNVFAPGKIAGNMLPGGFTVVQNTLNNQVVNNVMTVNASVTNANMYRDMNLTSLIRQGMLQAR